MAKLAVTLTLLIAFFVFTHAELPLDQPDDVSFSIGDPSITKPEQESKRTILLPSEKPESEPETVVDLDLKDSETTVFDSEPAVMEMVEEEEEKEKDGAPFLYRDLRIPVWERDARERRMFVFRHPRHRCQHLHHRHHHSFYHQFDRQRPGRREVSYGNDMLVAEAEPEKMVGVDLTELPLRLAEDSREVGLGQGGVRRAPSRWARFHFGERPRFHDHGPHHDHDEDEENDEHHRYERQEDEHRRRRHDHRHGRQEEGGEGLVNGIRKFLRQFEF